MLKSFFNKVAGLQACKFIEERFQHRCFPVDIANFLRTSILKNICERLLLIILLHSILFFYFVGCLSTFRVFVFPGPRPWLPIFIYRPWPQSCTYRPWPPICIYQPWPPPCVYQPWHQICIYWPFPKFVFTGPGHHLVFTPNLYLPAQPNA